MSGRVRVCVARGRVKRRTIFLRGSFEARTLGDNVAGRGGGFRRRAARCECSLSRFVRRRWYLTRGVGGAGVRSKWNWNGRLIRSRLRLLLLRRHFATVASHTNELAGANLARAPRRSLSFSTRRDATLGPEVRGLRETNEVRVSIQPAIRREYRDDARFERAPRIPNTSCTTRRLSLRRHPSMLSSRWFCFYRTRTSHTSVRRAPAKDREEGAVNLPEERISRQRTCLSTGWKQMCITSRLAHGWQSQSPGLSFDALHPLTLVLSLSHSAHRRSSGHCGAKRENASAGGGAIQSPAP